MLIKAYISGILQTASLLLRKSTPFSRSRQHPKMNNHTLGPNKELGLNCQRVKKTCFQASCSFCQLRTLPSLSLSDVPFPALLSTLIKSRCQAKPATLLIPIDLFLLFLLVEGFTVLGTRFTRFTSWTINQNVWLLGCVCKTCKNWDNCCCSTRLVAPTKKNLEREKGHIATLNNISKQSSICQDQPTALNQRGGIICEFWARKKHGSVTLRIPKMREANNIIYKLGTKVAPFP